MFWFLAYVLCSGQSDFIAFLWFLICGLAQVLFMSHVVNFKFSSSHFPVTTMDWICSEVHFLTSYCACDAQWLSIAESKGYAKLGASLSENGDRACVFKELDHGQSPPSKKNDCQLTSVILCSLIWIS